MERRRRQFGVTMVELVVVVAILGALAAVTIMTLIGLRTHVRRKATKDLLLMMDTALDEYHQTVGHYPPVLANGTWIQHSEKLWSELEKVDTSDQILQRINAKYIRNQGLIDAWGQPVDYRLDASGKVPTLTSSGPDKVPGTDDDITNVEGQL